MSVKAVAPLLRMCKFMSIAQSMFTLVTLGLLLFIDWPIAAVMLAMGQIYAPLAHRFTTARYLGVARTSLVVSYYAMTVAMYAMSVIVGFVLASESAWLALPVIGSMLCYFSLKSYTRRLHALYRQSDPNAC